MYITLEPVFLWVFYSGWKGSGLRVQETHAAIQSSKQASDLYFKNYMGYLVWIP